jgi:hypothetical protein
MNKCFTVTTNLPTITAIKAMSAGTASPEQQIMGMEWIVNNLCMVGEQSFDADNDRVTAFNEGRRFVGAHIKRAEKLPIDVILKDLRHG